MPMDKWWPKFAASRKGSTTLTSSAASRVSLASCQHVGAWVDSACMSVHYSFVIDGQNSNRIQLFCAFVDTIWLRSWCQIPGYQIIKFDVDPLSNSDSKRSNILFRAGGLITLPRICVESVSSAVLKYQHLPCDCELKSPNSEGVFRQLYADAWPRDHGRGYEVEMAGDEFLRWQVVTKDDV